MLFIVVPLIAVVIVPILIYVFLIWNFNYWRKLGVPGPKPRPLFGTFPSLLTQKQHFADDLNDIYTEYKTKERFIGVYMVRAPHLMILDPALAHEVFVTAFKHFHDNEFAKLIDKRKDVLIANNPFILNGQEWRKQRALVTPGLTGSRIKVAYAVMQNVCHELCNYILQESKMATKDGINAKDLALRFTAENVCDSVLGIKTHSFTKDPIPITKNVKKFAEENTIFLIYSIIAGFLPKLSNFYRAKFFPRDSEEFFTKLMKQAYTLRAANKSDRQDFMNHLLNLKEKKDLTETELYSHSMTFLIDGLDTTATVISHCLLMLGHEPLAQDKLYAEIVENSDENKELTFEKLNDLPYLDACVHESLRIFPPGSWSMKTCTEPYEITCKNGNKFNVPLDTSILIPVYAIQRDADFYPEPNKFKPERFLTENCDIKKQRELGLFLGFGDGPRTCLGMRFALTQTKAAISSIVRQFRIKVNPRTRPEYRLDPKMFFALHKGGVWLNFEERL